MKHYIFSRFFQVQGSVYNLSELAQYMAVFYFNMRTVHFNTTGKNFLELHEYAQELYEQAEDYYDDQYAEMKRRFMRRLEDIRNS